MKEADASLLELVGRSAFLSQPQTSTPAKIVSRIRSHYSVRFAVAGVACKPANARRLTALVGDGKVTLN